MLFFVFFYLLGFKMLFMSAAVLRLLTHSYSTVWLLAAEVSLVFSGAGRMRTTRRSWTTREATTEPAKASNHNALHMHNNRYSHPRLTNKDSHCMMKWMTLSEASSSCTCQGGCWYTVQIHAHGADFEAAAKFGNGYCVYVRAHCV